MSMKEICRGGYHRVLQARIPAGDCMEEHYTTSDTFVVVINGKAKLIFQDNVVDLIAGSTYLIPGLKPHSLEVSQDMEAYFTMAPMGCIENVNHKLIKQWV